MTIAEKISAAGVRTAAPRLRRHGIVCGLLSAALVVALSTGPAVADQAGPLQARAGDLTTQIAAGAQRIRRLTMQFQRASDQSASMASQLAQAEAQLAVTQQRIDTGRAVLARQAVRAYIEGGSSGRSAPGSSGGLAASSAMSAVVAGQEYLAVAAGNLTETIDQLHLSVRILSSQQTQLRRAQQAAQEAVSGLAQARQAALAEAVSEQSALDQVNTRLRQLAAEAARSAELMSPQQAVAASHQGLPVNGGLVKVVATATAPPPAAPPAPPPPVGGNGGAGGVWAALRQCESGGNYAENTGNGYFGAYQFSQATWSGLGDPGRPDLEPPAMQDAAAMRLQAQSGWGQWPACAAALGLI